MGLTDAQKTDLVLMFNDRFPPYSLARAGLLQFADEYAHSIPDWLRQLNMGDVIDGFMELRTTGRLQSGH
ncbi:MAG: hypothetical protein L3J96_06190 [Thermoplasmata archaeon]|jgi:hypothetical protein|nr:hypothetical protein [Thermoplasmata archaeon]